MIKKMISAVIASTNCYIANIQQIPDKKKSGAVFFQKNTLFYPHRAMLRALPVPAIICILIFRV